MKREKILLLSLGTGGGAENELCNKYFDHNNFKALQDQFYELYWFLKERDYDKKVVDKNHFPKQLHRDLITYCVNHMDQAGTALGDRNQRYSYPYMKTKYQMPSSQEVIETEYIGEVLIRSFQPDHTIVLGTGNSAWDNMYLKLSQSSPNKRMVEKDAISIYNLRADTLGNNINTDRAALKQYENEINGYLQKLKRIEKTDVRALLLRYGINEEQQKDNYQILDEAMQNYHDPDTIYEVAVDITHSFRSMPFEVITLLNYLRTTRNINMHISHIYYGCLEARSENHNVAPVVDLASMSDLQESVNAITLFKHMGTCREISKLIPEEDQEFRNALNRFDWALQTNLISLIAPALKQLMDVLNEADSKNHMSDDLKSMMKEVLQRELLCDYPVNMLDRAADDLYYTFWFQCSLTHWYYAQKQYGTLMSVEKECFRTLSVILTGSPDQNGEKDRQIAVERVHIIIDQLQNGAAVGPFLRTYQHLLSSLYQAYQSITNDRDVYAHNYLIDHDKPDIQKIDQLTYSFSSSLIQFRTAINDKNAIPSIREELTNAANDHSSNSKHHPAINKIIVCSSNHCNCELLNNWKICDIFKLPSKIGNLIPYNSTPVSQAEIVSSVQTLLSYLAANAEADEYKIIIFTRNKMVRLLYNAALNEAGWNSVMFASLERDFKQDGVTFYKAVTAIPNANNQLNIALLRSHRKHAKQELLIPCPIMDGPVKNSKPTKYIHL